MNSPGPCRGFTLIETLVAGVILALSAGVLGTSVMHAMASLSRARDYQKAAELLDKTFTRIDMVGPARLYVDGFAGGTFDPPEDRFSWQVEITPLTQGHLYQVTVNVFWLTPSGSRRSAEARTLLNDQPGSRPEGIKWRDL